MFGTNRSIIIESESAKLDLHLRFHDNCPNYIKSNQLNAAPNTDHILNDTIIRIGKKILFNKSDEKKYLTIKILKSLWSLCRFEATALNIWNRACLLFDIEDAIS